MAQARKKTAAKKKPAVTRRSGKQTIRVSGRGNTLTIDNCRVLPTGEVEVQLNQLEEVIMATKATTDAEQAMSGAQTKGVGAGGEAGFAQGAGGAYTEGGHKSASDVAAEEALSRIMVAGSEQLLRNAEAYSQISQTLIAGLADNAIRTNSNASDTANLVNKQAVAHRDIAMDGIWDVDNAADAAVAKALARYVGGDE